MERGLITRVRRLESFEVGDLGEDDFRTDGERIAWIGSKLTLNPLATVGAYRRLEILHLWYWERL